MPNTAKNTGKNKATQDNRKQLQEILRVWPTVAPFLSVPHTEEEYQRAVEILDMLLDESGGSENHSLAPLIDVMGTLIEAFENKHIPQPKGNPVEVLKFLMTEHQLKQTELPEIGSQGIVSEVLTGKRKLNLRQIKALSKRFNVSPLIFLGETA